MYECPQDGCGWRAVAPSRRAAHDQYAEHVVDEHAEVVDGDIPDGMVQVRLGKDDEWRTVTLEEAKRIHNLSHNE